MKMLLTLSAVLFMNVSASAAMAGGVSYSGNSPLTVTGSQIFDGTYCLTLKDDGAFGWPHSGTAAVDSQLTGNLIDGTFQLIGNTLVATIVQPSGGQTNQNATLLFTGRASKGSSTTGFFEQALDGEELDSGKVVFGTKGGC